MNRNHLDGKLKEMVIGDRIKEVPHQTLTLKPGAAKIDSKDDL